MKTQKKTVKEAKNSDLEETSTVEEASLNVEQDMPIPEPVEVPVPTVTVRPVTSPSLPQVQMIQQPTDDRVKITMVKTIDPAPQMGKNLRLIDLGILKLEQSKTYLLPRIAADVLIDSKVAFQVA